jgi:hypothetical protein
LKPRQRFDWVITILALAAIAAATLVPNPEQAQTAADTNVWCLVCGDLGVVDVGLNVLLFVPLGIGLSLLTGSRLRTLVIVALTSLTVEVLQLSVVAGRDASLSDLLTNTAGGMLGYWLGPNLGRAAFPGPVAGFRLAVGGMVLWLLQQGFTGWALERKLPPSVYYGQWAPELGQFDRFTGTVSRVSLNGLSLGNGRFKRSDVVRAELGRPAMELDVAALSGTLTEETAPIFSIFDDHQREILLVGARGRDLVFHLRTRLDGFRLRSPSIVLKGAIPEAPGQRMAIRVRYDGSRYRLEARDANSIFVGEVPVSASWGWSLVLPFVYGFGPGARWPTMLWLGGLWFLIGYWAAMASERGALAWWAFIGVTLLAGLAGIPSITGLERGALSEWIGALLGAAIGWVLGTSLPSWRFRSANASSLS